MEEFERLKEKQRLCLGEVRKFRAILDSMGSSGVDLLEQKLKEPSSNYVKLANGLAQQLQTLNISLSVVAEVSNGKSTFLNALIFKDQVLHSGIGAVTAQLFKIDYGEAYTATIGEKTSTYSSIESFKKAVEDLNAGMREKIDQQNTSDLDIRQVYLTLPNSELKKGISLYDTPGFGSLDEAQVYPIIGEAVSKSDAVIMLIDIAQGIKKGEASFVRDVLKSIPPDKRFVVFNKIDSVINEDQKELMGEEELNRQLNKVINDTLKELSSITEIPHNTIKNYSLSSQKALAGFKSKNQQKIDESRFQPFETDFWHCVVNSKKEVFENRICSYNRLLENCSNRIIKETKKTFEKDYMQIEALKTALLEKKAAFSAFSKQSIDALNGKIKGFSSNPSTAFNKDVLFKSIQDILENNIYETLVEISWVDKLKIWNIKDKYLLKIENALKDSSFEIIKATDNYINNLVKELYSAQNGMNEVIIDINKKIEGFSDLGVSPLDYIDILEQKKDGNFRIKTDSSLFSDDVSMDKEIFVFIGGIIAEVIAGRLLLLIPGIGLAIGVALAAVMKIYKTVSDPNRELASKIAAKVIDGLKSDLSLSLEPHIAKYAIIKHDMASRLLSARHTLKMIENSFENPEEKEKKLAKLKTDIATVNRFENELKTLKGDK